MSIHVERRQDPCRLAQDLSPLTTGPPPQPSRWRNPKHARQGRRVGKARRCGSSSRRRRCASPRSSDQRLVLKTREAHLQILQLEERASFNRYIGGPVRIFASQIPNDDAANIAKYRLNATAANVDEALQKVERTVSDSVSSWIDGKVYLTPEGGRASGRVKAARRVDHRLRGGVRFVRQGAQPPDPRLHQRDGAPRDRSSPIARHTPQFE